MDKLKLTIEQHGRWSYLIEYIDRIEGHIESDFSHALENAKALLESIGKEICDAKDVELRQNSSINGVIKQTCSALGFNSDGFEAQISGSLTNIGQQMGDLRNKIGIIAHGRTAQEMRERNDSIDMLTREFLIDSTLVVAVFLIRAFENENRPVLKDRIDYSEATDFNDFWDESFGEFEMGDYSYIASEILYNVDYKAYETEHRAFTEAEPEIEAGEE
ncbi:MAG: abortive infection family protein [Methylobacter sp.]|nr:abortive infection family protein [Methylobacter sp.]